VNHPLLLILPSPIKVLVSIFLSAAASAASFFRVLDHAQLGIHAVEEVVTYTTQQLTQGTNIHEFNAIRTRDPSNQATPGLRCRPHGRRNRPAVLCTLRVNVICLQGCWIYWRNVGLVGCCTVPSGQWWWWWHYDASKLRQAFETLTASYTGTLGQFNRCENLKSCKILLPSNLKLFARVTVRGDAKAGQTGQGTGFRLEGTESLVSGYDKCASCGRNCVKK